MRITDSLNKIRSKNQQLTEAETQESFLIPEYNPRI